MLRSDAHPALIVRFVACILILSGRYSPLMAAAPTFFKRLLVEHVVPIRTVNTPLLDNKGMMGVRAVFFKAFKTKVIASATNLVGHVDLLRISAHYVPRLHAIALCRS
jgi:hypothetical protein